MPPKRRGNGKVTEGRKRKGKKNEDETPPKTRMDGDDKMDILDVDMEPMIEMDEDDLPSTSRGTGKKRGRAGPPLFVTKIIEKNSKCKVSDDEPSSSRYDSERRAIPQFVVDKIEKKAKEWATPVADTFSPSGISEVIHDGDKRATTMRELTTLLRILSRGRYDEITEGQTEVAISNTGTEEIRVIEEDRDTESSSGSEDEWEEMELADPEEDGDGEAANKKNIEIRLSGSADKQKDWRTKWLRTEINIRVRENRADLQKAIFLSLLAHCRYLTRCALDEQLLPSVMLTTVPSGYRSLANQFPQRSRLTKLLKWFKSAFRPSREVTITTPKEGYRFGLTARLEGLVERKEYEDCTDASLLIFAMFHSLEWTTRLVKNFSVHLPWEKEEKGREKRREKGRGKGEVKGREKGKAGEGKLDAWAEVWMSEEKKWISIDPLSGMIMDDDEVEERLIQPLQYVIAVDNKFGIREIAFRFTSAFSTPKLRKRRKMDYWIKETLSMPAFRSDGFRARAEDYEFHSRIVKRAIPTTIGELKGHPLYVMEKDLKKYEAIYPRDTEPIAEVGKEKKEKVFQRSYVHQLQGSINWIKFGRDLKEGEEPYKIVSKRASVAGGPAESLPLYGYWQTKQYQVPKIIDGRVPRNQFGNVYMYRPEMCPEGGVHLRFPGMMAMARNLNLEAVPAVVGWQCQGGRNVPILDGAVVLEKDEKIFNEEFKKRFKEEEKKELKKRETRIWGNWRRLIRGAMRLKSLNERFADGEDHF